MRLRRLFLWLASWFWLWLIRKQQRRGIEPFEPRLWLAYCRMWVARLGGYPRLADLWGEYGMFIVGVALDREAIEPVRAELWIERFGSERSGALRFFVQPPLTREAMPGGYTN